jgi:pyruvate formate lyase activating enzyme
MQIDVLVSFLKELKQMGIHTAIETNGCFSAEDRARLVSCTDLFLYDIKHMDSAKHEQFTGVPNEEILDNIHKLAVDYGSEVIMRVPLIPGFNDDEDNMKATARLGKELAEKGRLLGVHLLGFHNMASGKYEALQRKYGYRETPGYSDEQLNRFTEYFKNEHVNVQIGG